MIGLRFYLKILYDASKDCNQISHTIPKTLMSVPLKGPKLNPAITPITEVGIPGTAHMIAVKNQQ